MPELKKQVFDYLQNIGIEYEAIDHPPTPTIADVLQYWKGMDAVHCKNLFFRNHKGNQHYLVIFHYLKDLSIHSLEQMLKQGKLSFASAERMDRFLGVTPGSVSPFGLINDTTKHVVVFADENLLQHEKLSFHPNDNSCSVVIRTTDFIRFLTERGNRFSFIKLY